MAGKKRLYRSEEDRVIGGVAGGLAEYFDVDSVLTRVIFVALIFSPISAVLVYIVLWIVMPTKSDLKDKSEGEKVEEGEVIE